MRSLETFLKQLDRWTVSEKIVKGCALVGSCARGTAAENSDVDLVILAENPRLLLAQTDWVHQFGAPVSRVDEDWGLLQSLRVHFEDGLEVEFGISSPRWASTDPVDEGTQAVVVDGFRVLYDPESLFRSLEEKVAERSKRPGPSLSILTHRLRMEPLSVDWAEAVFREFNDEITTYSEALPPENLASLRALIQKSRSELEKGTNCTLAILSRVGGDFLGCLSLHRPYSRQPEIGLWIKKSAQRKGIGKEAVNGVRHWAEQNLDHELFLYPVDRDNLRSRKIPESLGGVVRASRQKECPNGKTLRLVIYEISRI